MEPSDSMGMEATGMYMSSPAEMMNMNMFEDGAVDVAALFSAASDFNMGQHLPDPHDPLYGRMSVGNTLISSP